ncbi:uncharacterized protein NPIL_155112 [Nephila pilipes]|uniref:Uncharacterized protein n=1 Tax=Nephila pilipes TaxID=299642 RepID=A0A8X6JWD7_NEPPI|nr:uncharacterized protein NPIL_155112 [Nephila pilipes]
MDVRKLSLMSIGTEKSTRTTPWVQPTSHRLNKLNRRNILKIPFIWKIFKSVIFIVCISCFSWQSFNFFQLYFKYPTATHIDLTFPEVLKKPAITFCNNNPVRRDKFCDAYPDLCQKPDNISEFCEMHPYFCVNDTSDFVIPKLGYYASNLTDDVRDAIMEIYVHNISQDGAKLWSWAVPNEQENRSKEEVETTIFNGTFHSTHVLNTFEIEIRENETVYPWTVPQIMLNIHSPFDPVYPFYEAEYLKLGHMYLISIRIEEEHLLEYPYQTNCTDYEYLWEKNNKTGPRSQKMCTDWCFWNYLKPCDYCDEGVIIEEKPIWICEYVETCEYEEEDFDNLKNCRSNCNVDCKKLNYRYEIHHRDLFSAMMFRKKTLYYLPIVRKQKSYCNSTGYVILLATNALVIPS